MLAFIIIMNGLLFIFQSLSFDLSDLENDVLVHFLVHGQLSSLAEGTVAARVVTFERFLLSVDIHVLLEVLG